MDTAELIWQLNNIRALVDFSGIFLNFLLWFQDDCSDPGILVTYKLVRGAEPKGLVLTGLSTFLSRKKNFAWKARHSPTSAHFHLQGRLQTRTFTKEKWAGCQGGEQSCHGVEPSPKSRCISKKEEKSGHWMCNVQCDLCLLSLCSQLEVRGKLEAIRGH
jgi:hypothetical protein